MTRKLGKLHEYKLCFYSKISFFSGLIIYTWQIFNFVNRFSNRESKKKARQQRKREQAQRRRDRDLKSGKVEAVRRAARERMSKLRFGRSDEKYKQDRENARLGKSTSRKNQLNKKTRG